MSQILARLSQIWVFTTSRVRWTRTAQLASSLSEVFRTRQFFELVQAGLFNSQIRSSLDIQLGSSFGSRICQLANSDRTREFAIQTFSNSRLRWANFFEVEIRWLRIFELASSDSTTGFSFELSKRVARRAAYIIYIGNPFFLLSWYGDMI